MNKQEINIADFKDVIACYPELSYSSAQVINSGRTLVVKVLINDGFTFQNADKEKVLLDWMGESVPEHSDRYLMFEPRGLALCYKAAKGVSYYLTEKN